MAHPDIFSLQKQTQIEILKQPGISIDERVTSVIGAFFNHPSLHTYLRNRDFHQYYNPATEQFESVLRGHIGRIFQNTGELVISSPDSYMHIIQPFQEAHGVVRWEGLTLKRDKSGQFHGEMVNRYYRYDSKNEPVEVSSVYVPISLDPKHILNEAMNVYDTFRVRYD